MRTCISYDQSPVEVDLESRFLIVADPLALEGLRSIAPPPKEKLTRSVLSSSLSKLRNGFRVYVHEIPSFSPGTHRIAFEDIIATDDEVPGSSASVDSGFLVFFDYAKREAVLAHLTWESFDFALRDATPKRFEEITQKVGARCFGIMVGNADARSDFVGDGSYALKKNSPKRIG